MRSVIGPHRSAAFISFRSGSIVLRVLLALLSLGIILAVLGGAAWLWTGAGTPELAVPDEIGIPADVAASNLRKLGLTVELIDEQGPDTMVGQVLRMAPSPGSFVKPGRRIILYVGAGAGVISVPDLVGTYLIDAENRLARAGVESGVLGGLRLGERTQVGHDSPAGTILSQQPAPGTLVKPGTAVSIVVAVPGDGTRMPNLVDKPVAAAIDSLAIGGYTPIQEPYYTTARAPGTILSQEPAPGSLLRPDQVIRLIIATPPASRSDAVDPTPPPDPTSAPTGSEPTTRTPGAEDLDNIKPAPTRAPEGRPL